MQSRGPNEKGWNASRLSLKQILSFDHRSGIKDSGSEKFFALWYMAYCHIETTVFEMFALVTS